MKYFKKKIPLGNIKSVYNYRYAIEKRLVKHLIFVFPSTVFITFVLLKVIFVVFNTAIDIKLFFLLIITISTLVATATSAIIFLKFIDEIRDIVIKLIDSKEIFPSINTTYYDNDIVSLKKFIDQLKKRISIQTKQAAIGQTTAMIAHDIREPFCTLKSILNSFELIKNSPSFLETSKIELEKSINHVESMLTDIMDFSREIELETYPVSLNKIIDFSVRHSLKYFDESVKKQINYVYTIEHNIKPIADEDRISRAFINILKNAIEAIEIEGVISIRTKDIIYRDNKNIKIVISNSGKSIKEEDLPNIFECFFTKGKAKGTGIGLASVYKIITLHNGKISIRNKNNGKGVEVIIIIPSSEIKEDTTDIILPKCTDDVISYMQA